MEKDQCYNHAGHEAQIKALEHSCVVLFETTQRIIEGKKELRERVTIVEQSSKSAHHRLDSMEKLTEAIAELANGLRDLSKDTRTILDRMEKHDELFGWYGGRIDKIEKRPGVIAVKSWVFVGTIFATAILSFIIARAGL